MKTQNIWEDPFQCRGKRAAPAGPAEVIVLVQPPGATLDRLSAEEDQLDAAASAAVGEDGRFQVDGELLVFTGEIPAELEDELDHRRARELMVASARTRRSSAS